jgi:hypothetical protein
MNTIAQAAPVVIAVSGWVVAQASGLDPGIANLIGNGITVVVLAFYVVYDVRVRTPAMLDGFNKEQSAQRQLFREEQKDSRELFRGTIDANHKTFLAEQAALRQENRDDRALIRQKHDDEIAEWRKMLERSQQMLNDALSSDRKAVHDIRDVATTVIAESKLAGQKEG